MAFYYSGYRFGEILDGRYEVIAAHGKGVFSSVVRAKDLKAGPGDPAEVAIKIIRSNDTMWVIVTPLLLVMLSIFSCDGTSVIDFCDLFACTIVL